MADTKASGMSNRYLLCPACPALNRVPLTRLEQRPRCGKCKAELDLAPVLSADPQTLGLAVRSAPGPVVVDFWAPWCGPCLRFAPVFEDYARREAGQALFLKLNTQDHPQVAERYGIRGIPTLMVFEAGREKARQSGAMSYAQLDEWLRRTAYGPP